MKSKKFDVGTWTRRLARRLERLAEVQEQYWEELYKPAAGGLPSTAYIDPSERYRHFYWRASRGKSRYARERYAPVRVLLGEIGRILAVHPAWAGLVDETGNGEVWFQLAGGGGMRSPSRTIGGLMARGKELRKDGFRAACRELSLLLESNDEMEEDPARAELLTGYHVVLIQGLKVEADLRIDDEMKVMPFDRLDAFVDASMLERLAPEVGRYGGGKSIAALVKPFRWKPEFRKHGENSWKDDLQVGSFFDDAVVLVELLALFHAAPVVRLASVANRLNKRACLLLGSLDFHQSYGAGLPSWSAGRPGNPVEARRDAIDEALKAFAERNGERYRYCAPVIARLAEALARQGRFRTDDRILDVAIALERMYQLDQGEITYKLKTRAACFLESTTSARKSVFNDVNKLYGARSGIVHARSGKKKKRSKNEVEQERKDAFERGFDVARRSVVTLLSEGRPEDWNEVILKVHEKDGPTLCQVAGRRISAAMSRSEGDGRASRGSG